MTTLTIKTNNLQTSDVLISDMGIIIPANGGSEILTSLEDIEDARLSQDLRDLTSDNTFGVGSNTLIVNDGISDLTGNDIITFLDFANVGEPPPLHNFTAIVDPTINDDDLLGYESGSRWINQITNTHFILIDIDSGGANWVATSDRVLQGSSVYLELSDDDDDDDFIEIDGIIGIELPNNITKTVKGQRIISSNSIIGANPNLIIELFVRTVGSGDGNVRLQMGGRYIADGELASKPNDETILQTVAITNTLKQRHSVTFSLTAGLLLQSDFIHIEVSRLGSDAADTWTGKLMISSRARIEFIG